MVLDKFQDDSVIIFGIIKQTDGVTPTVDDKIKDKSNKKKCKVCGKNRIQVRCEIHTKAKGCTYCHLVKEHL